MKKYFHIGTEHDFCQAKKLRAQAFGKHWTKCLNVSAHIDRFFKNFNENLSPRKTKIVVGIKLNDGLSELFFYNLEDEVYTFYSIENRNIYIFVTIR